MPKKPARAPVEPGPSRRDMHGQIVNAIGRRILRGDIRPGEVLSPHPDLSASRTAMREALRVLAAKGLVEARPKVGTRVRPREAWNLLDPDVLAWHQEDEGLSRTTLLRSLTEVRGVVEPAAAELAAARATPPEVGAIADAYRSMEEAVTGAHEDLDAYVQADLRFHTAILQACHNHVLEQMSRTVYAALGLSFRATTQVAGRAAASLPQHRAILKAIRAGQPAEAGRAMRTLLRRTAKEIESVRRKSAR